MIYFLVNNDYQCLEAERLAAELRESDLACSLIAIPHTLTRQGQNDLFDKVIVLETPARLRWPLAWRNYLNIHTKVNRAFDVTPQDVLFLFTEFELLNQLVAIHFKSSRARTYLIEDGGVGTYIPLALKKPQSYTLKDHLYQWMVRRIPKLGQTNFTKFDGINFPMLNDRHLDGVCLYRGMAINRALPVQVIRRPKKMPISPTIGRAVFLNQPLYCEYIQTEALYEEGLKTIFAALNEGFNEILFKFHPRESSEARTRISALILEICPKVRFIEKNQPFESLLGELRPEAVVSYNSTPLLNLAGTGVQPLFVYHLLEDLRHQASFNTMHALLEAWGYQFARGWHEVASGYEAGEIFSSAPRSMPLADLVLRSAS